jgi:hypothetical protein
LHAFVEGSKVVRVTREDGVVVVGCILNERIIPPITNEDTCKIDMFGVGDIGGVLGLNILIEYWSYASTISSYSKYLI